MFNFTNALFKQQDFYIEDGITFLKNALRREEGNKGIAMMTYGDNTINFYSNESLDSMGIMSRGDLPLKIKMHNDLSEKTVETLFDGGVRYVNLMVNMGEHLIQFSLLKKDIGPKTKVTCMYESVDELAYALQFLKDYTR